MVSTRQSQEGAQDGFGDSQEKPEMAPGGLRGVLDGLEDGSRSPNKAQDGLRHAPHRSLTGPSGLGASPRRLREGDLPPLPARLWLIGFSVAPSLRINICFTVSVQLER